jgi:hypothetical protein
MKELNHRTITETTASDIIQLADNMASAASNFNQQQGYDTFIGAREQFCETVKQLFAMIGAS